MREISDQQPIFTQDHSNDIKLRLGRRIKAVDIMHVALRW